MRRYLCRLQYDGQFFRGTCDQDSTYSVRLWRYALALKSRRKYGCALIKQDSPFVHSSQHPQTSVVATLNLALSLVFGPMYTTSAVVSSRTDSGVHAEMNTFHFDTIKYPKKNPLRKAFDHSIKHLDNINPHSSFSLSFPEKPNFPFEKMLSHENQIHLPTTTDIYKMSQHPLNKSELYDALPNDSVAHALNFCLGQRYIDVCNIESMDHDPNDLGVSANVDRCFHAR